MMLRNGGSINLLDDRYGRYVDRVVLKSININA